MVSPAANKPYEAEFLEQLKQEIPKAERAIWLDGVHLTIAEDGALVSAPSEPQLEVLRSRWETPILNIVRGITDDMDIEVRFGCSTARKKAVAKAEPDTLAGVSLRPGFTFDSFITGPSNKLAYAAALSVSENPGSAYNPFFIHGSVGLGKTHLLHAIAHRLLEQGYKKIIVASCATFTNEFIAALTSQKIDRFRDRYRSADALLIDDIQFLSEKERTQEEFFHTFNDIYNREQQLVLTSDAPPKAIEGLSERLVSRFRLGLVVQLEAPDLETRVAIINRKLLSREISLDPAVVEQIALRINDNVRELEGAVLRVESMVRHEGIEATAENVNAALNEIFGQETKRIDLGTIEEQVCEYFSVTPEQLRSSRRTRSIVLPRQISMYLCRLLTGCSLGEIGKHFGGRDHTTVMHSIDKIRTAIGTDSTLRRDLESIESKLLR